MDIRTAQTAMRRARTAITYSARQLAEAKSDRAAQRQRRTLWNAARRWKEAARFAEELDLIDAD